MPGVRLIPLASDPGATARVPPRALQRRARVLPRAVQRRAWVPPRVRQRRARASGGAVNDVVLWRRLVAELLGSAFLAAVVIGSGIPAVQLSGGNVGLELFENATATAAGLFAILLMFGPVSVVPLNPLLS